MDASNLLFAGDINFHMDGDTNNDTRRFSDVFKHGNLTQHVEGPTHVAGHTIDGLITRSSDAILNNIRIYMPHMSDHSAMQCTLRLAKPPNIQVTTTELQTYQYRCGKNYAVDMYNETIGAINDKHAPLLTRTVTVRPHTPWYNDSIPSQKCVRRQLEQRQRTIGLEFASLSRYPQP